MQLLVQVWCPLENSPNDRALYIWGCARGPCQKKEGSVRAWRGLRYNTKYAEKLAKRQAKQKAKEEEQAKAAAGAARMSTPKANPFSMKTTGSSNAFNLGGQIFGSVAEPPHSEPATSLDEREAESLDEEESDENSDNEEDADADLAAHMAKTALDDSQWTSAMTAYSPLYLSTVPEYLPPARKVKVPAGAEMNEDDEGKKTKDGGWTLEGYENSIEVDHAFERFTKRVGYEGEQCLRYELGGTPLPFSSDSIFDKLFPAPSAPPLPVTKPDFMVAPAQKRMYDPSAVPTCPHCKSRRVFECQLMPNLINVLKAPTEDGKAKMSDEERRQEVLRALKGEKVDDRVGMEWGTCMVFSCEKDCSEDGARGCWREEVVLMQWDD